VRGSKEATGPTIHESHFLPLNGFVSIKMKNARHVNHQDVSIIKNKSNIDRKVS
jgi:hypothetical protein